MAHKYSHYNIMPFVSSSCALSRLEHQQSDLRAPGTNEVVSPKRALLGRNSMHMYLQVLNYQVESELNLCGCMVCATDIHSCHVRYMATMNIRTTFHTATKVALLWLLFYS